MKWGEAGDGGAKRSSPSVSLSPRLAKISLLALWESNAPYSGFSKISTARYDYDVHPMLNAVWGIPFNAGIPLSFEGYANFIGSKGKNEFGADTARETNIDMLIMYDMSAALGAKKNSFRVGIEYQYWKNKFGNNHKGPAGSGAFAKTPMLRADYHF